MGEQFDIKAGIKLEKDTEFKSAITSVNKTLTSLKSELKLVETQFDGNANSMQALQKKHEVLNKILEEQKRKVESTDKALKNSQKEYDRLGQTLEQALGKYDEENEKLAELKRIYGENSNEVKTQVKVLQQLETQINKGNQEYAKAGDRVKEWETKLNTANTQMIKAEGALSRNAAYMNEAKNSTNKCATSIDGFGKKVKQAAEETKDFNEEASAMGENAGGITEVVTGLGEKIGQGLVTKGIDLATEAFGKLVEKVKEVATESDRASSQLQAATGLSDEMAEKYSAVMDSIRGDNFGEDYDDVADVMSQIVQIMGELDSSKMKETAENAITLRDTFGMDYNETIRAVNSLMKNMGLTAQEAFDYITKGAQTGLDRSGELVDNITEYSQLWGQAGFSAEEMFSVLDNGLQNGAYNLDKVNDFVKEFGISLSDGRIEESIDSFSAKSQELFASYQKGEADVKDVFYSIISDLSEMENEQTALTLASNVWSSLGEDNAMKVIASLDDVNTKYNNVRGAAEELKEVKYDDLESSIEALGQTMTEKLVTPIVDVAVPAVKEAVDWLNNALTIEPEPSVINDAWSVFENNRDSLAGLKTAREQDAAATDIQTASIDAYKTKLMELQSVEEKDGAYKAELAQTMMEMGSLIPEIADAYDAEAYSLDLTAEQVEQYAEAAKNAAMANAALAEQDSLTESINNTNQALTAAEVLLGDIQNIKKERPLTIDEEMDEASLQEWVKYLKDELEVYEKELESSQKASGELAKANEELAESANNVGEAQEETAKSTAQVAAEYKAMGYTSGEAARMAEDYAEKLEEAREASLKRAEAERAAAEIQKSSMQSVLESYNEMVQSITADLQNKVSLFDKFDGGTDMTTEKMNENLNDQVEKLKKYQENLEKVRNMVDENGKAVVSDEFFQYIQDMGIEGANMLEHMVYTWEEQGEYGAEQIRSMNDQYCEAMDLTESIGETMATNKIAYESAMREFASSDADFSDLRDSIAYAAMYAGEGWKGLSESTKSALEETISTVQECGGQIPEGLAEAIESGEVSPEEAIQQLNASLQGQFDALAEIAEENGIQVPEYLKEGIQAGGDEAVNAFAEIIESLAAYNTEFEKAGQENGETFASGVESQAETASEAAVCTSNAAVEAVNEAAEEYKTAGENLITALAQGMSMAAETVKTEISSVAQSGTVSAEGYTDEYQYAGMMLALGFARGITQGRSQAIDAAVQMAVQALQAAKEALDIHSPSKKFQQEVGEQISKGMAFGIKTKKVLAKNASAEMSKEVLKEATTWLESYKESHKVSLEDEKYFWEEVSKNTKKGTSAYKQAQKEVAKISSEILKIENNFGVSWQENGKTKEAETYYSEVYSAANKYMSNMKIIRDVDLREEEAYWKAVIKQLQKGTQAWYDAQKRLKTVQNSIKQEQQTVKQEKAQKKQEQKDYAVSGDALDTYKTYFNVSAQAEVDYWDIVRKKFKVGTQEREEADKKYFEAKKNVNEQLVALEKDYYDKVSEVNSRLEEDISELTEEYESAVADRAKAIYSSFSLTDKFESETDDGATLLYNLKTQVVGLEDWREQLDKLKEKGVDEEFIEELQDMGPEASALLHVLNNDLPDDLEGKGMTDAELEEYISLWKQKKEIAQQQAEEENEQLRTENEKKIEELREQAKKEIEAYTEEYLQGVNELTTPITSSLKKVANNALKWGEETVSSFVQGLSKKSTSKNSVSKILSTTTAITTNLASLEKEGKTIGTNTLEGILSAMNNSKKIKKSTSKMVQAIVEATKKAAKINSPSKLFEEEIGEFIPAGVGEGVEKNTAAAVKPAENMITQMLDAAEAEQRVENEKLSAYMQTTNFDDGIARLNTALQLPISNTTNVNVDNSDLIGILTQFLGKVEEIAQNADTRQIVLDDGTLVARLQQKISQASGQISRRMNRGKY